MINNKSVTYAFVAQGDSYDVAITDHEGIKTDLTLTDSHFDKSSGYLFFTINNKPYKVHVASSQDSQDQLCWDVSFAHTKQPVRVGQYYEQTSVHPAVQADSELCHQPGVSNVLKSPLAGRVSKIFAQPSDHVKKGQPLFLIESMKMENEICASQSAFIKTIFIAEGNVVQQNQILVDFEGEGESNAATKNAYEQKAVQDR